jgi:hypothetical protein
MKEKMQIYMTTLARLWLFRNCMIDLLPHYYHNGSLFACREDMHLHGYVRNRRKATLFDFRCDIVILYA